MRTVKLTLAQEAWVGWALDAMHDYWAGLAEQGEIDEEPPMPILNGTNLTLPDAPEVIADLLYRLEEQAPDVARCDGGHNYGAALRAAEIIRG